ncbi:MAG: nitroreductase [Proteobacteria bacterium]|nr:nitroreductase [Pseudomonadota bacterium]MBU1688437.1 nitroreductase [Pseudomonadota bacterium]
MNAINCIAERMSIRSFKEDPVPESTLREVLTLAGRSPSYKNSQPWEVMVLSGARKAALTVEMTRLLESGAPQTPDLADPTSWPEAEEGRIHSLYQKRKETTGIDLADPSVIIRAKKANFAFYGAPHALYLYQDNSLSLWSLFDLGLFAQTLMLAAQAHGLGTVPQAFVTDYAAEIKQFLGIPTQKRLVLGLSIGYPNMESPANKLKTDRSPIDDFVRFVC